MSEELKPCPFCGGEARLESYDDWYNGAERKRYLVECENHESCGAKNISRFTEKQAFAAWNCRAEPETGIPATGTLRTSWETPNTCNKCAEHLAADWSYCPECGTPQHEPDMGNPVSEKDICKLVTETLDEVGIPYENKSGEFVFNGLGALDHNGDANGMVKPTEIEGFKNDHIVDTNKTINDPLTLTELATRTKPVWVNADIAWSKLDGYYCLCNHGRITPPSGFSFRASDRNWVFYDHKPEGEK